MRACKICKLLFTQLNSGWKYFLVKPVLHIYVLKLYCLAFDNAACILFCFFFGGKIFSWLPNMWLRGGQTHRLARWFWGFLNSCFKPNERHWFVSQTFILCCTCCLINGSDTNLTSQISMTTSNSQISFLFFYSVPSTSPSGQSINLNHLARTQRHNSHYRTKASKSSNNKFRLRQNPYQQIINYALLYN